MGTQTTITIDGAAVDLSATANAPRTWVLVGGTGPAQPAGSARAPFQVAIYKSTDGGTSYQYVRTLSSGSLTTENPVLPGVPILGTHVKAVTTAGDPTGAVLIVGTDGSAAGEDSINVPALVGNAGTVADLNTRGELRSLYLTGDAGTAFKVETSQNNADFQAPFSVVVGAAPYDLRGQYRYVRLRRTSPGAAVALLVSTPTPAGAAGAGGGAPTTANYVVIGPTPPQLPDSRQLVEPANSGIALVDNGAGINVVLFAAPLAKGRILTTDGTPTTLLDVPAGAFVPTGDGTYLVSATMLGFLTGTPATAANGEVSAEFTRAAGAITIVSQKAPDLSALTATSLLWADDGASGVKLVATGLAATDITWTATVPCGALAKVA